MNIKILFVTTLLLALSIKGNTQTLDKAKLDQFFDQLDAKKQAMGSVTIVKDGTVLYTRTIGYSQINGTDKKPLTAANKFRIDYGNESVAYVSDTSLSNDEMIIKTINAGYGEYSP